MKGVLPDRILKEFIEQGYIASDYGKETLLKNVQPSSLDLTLGKKVYEIRGEPTHGIQLEKIIVREFEINDWTVLQRGKTYLVELQEYFRPEKLKKKYEIGIIYVHTNPKSSAGRTGIISKIWAPGNELFDVIPPNYEGKIYSLILPKAFPVKVKEGVSINQMRIFYQRPEESELNPEDMYNALEKNRIYLLTGRDDKPVEKVRFYRNGIEMTMYLPKGEVSILEAKKTKKPLILKPRANKVDDFFTRKKVDKDGTFLLKKDGFYIIATRELLKIPIAETLKGTGVPPFVIEIAAYDEGTGEFRSHAAGFVEYGFGVGSPSLIIMEIHPHTDLVVGDGSPVAILRFYEFHEPPETRYQGSYNQQGLTPGKYFKE